MFEEKVIELLNRVCSSFIEGIDHSKLTQMNLWGGKIVLSNLHIKPEVLDFLDLPFQLNFGLLGSVTIKIQLPFISLSRKNMSLEVSDVLILMTSKPETQWDPEAYRDEYLSNKIAMLSAESLGLVVNHLEGNGFVWNTALSFLETLEVTIHNVHVRLEDYTTNDAVAYAFGMVIRDAVFKLNLERSKEKTVDLPFQHLFTDNGKLPQSVKYRTIDLDGFGLYIDQLDPLSHVKPFVPKGSENISFEDLSESAGEESSGTEKEYVTRVRKSYKKGKKRSYASKVYRRYSETPRRYSSLFEEKEEKETKKMVIDHTNSIYTTIFNNVLNYLVTEEHTKSCSKFVNGETSEESNMVWESQRSSARSVNSREFLRNTSTIRTSNAFKRGFTLTRKSRSSLSKSFKSSSSDNSLKLTKMMETKKSKSEEVERERVNVSTSWRMYLAKFCDLRKKEKTKSKTSAEIIANALKRREQAKVSASSEYSSDDDFDCSKESCSYTEGTSLKTDRQTYQEEDESLTSRLENEKKLSGDEYLEEQIVDEFEKRRLLFGIFPRGKGEKKLENESKKEKVEEKMNETSQSETSGSGEGTNLEEESYTSSSYEYSDSEDNEYEEYEPEDLENGVELDPKGYQEEPHEKREMDTPTTADTTSNNKERSATSSLEDEEWTCLTYLVREDSTLKLRDFIEELKKAEHNYILNTRDFRGLGSFYFCSYPILPSKKYSSCWSEWGSKYGRVSKGSNDYLPRCSVFLVFEDIDLIMSKEQMECIFNLIYHNVFKYFYWISGVISTFESARATPEDEKMYMEYWPQFLLCSPTKDDKKKSKESSEDEETDLLSELFDFTETEPTTSRSGQFGTEQSVQELSLKEIREFVADFEILNSIPTIRILRNRASDGLNKLIRGFGKGRAPWEVGGNMNDCITNLLFTNICSSYQGEEETQRALTTRLQERLQFVGGIYEVVSKQTSSSGMITSLKKLCTHQTFNVDLAVDLLFVNSRVIITNKMHTSTGETDVKGYILSSNGMHLFFQDTFGRDGSQFIEFEVSPFSIFTLDVKIEDHKKEELSGEFAEEGEGNASKNRESVEEAGHRNECGCCNLRGTPSILMTCGDCGIEHMKKNRWNILSLLLGEQEETYLLPPVLYFSSDFNHFRIPGTPDVRVRLHLDSEVFMHFPILEELNHIFRIYRYNVDKHSSTFPVKIDDNNKRMELLASEESIVYELVDLGKEYQRLILEGSVSYLNYDFNVDMCKGLFFLFDVNLKGSYFTYALILDQFTAKTLTKKCKEEEQEEEKYETETLDSELLTDVSDELKYSESMQGGTRYDSMNVINKTRMSCLGMLENEEKTETTYLRGMSKEPEEMEVAEDGEEEDLMKYADLCKAEGEDKYIDMEGYDIHVLILSDLKFYCLNGMYELKERTVYMGKNCSISLQNYLESVLKIKTKYLEKVEEMTEFVKLLEENVNMVKTDREVKMVVKTATNLVPQSSPNLIVSLDIGSLYVNLRDVDMVGLICSMSDYKQIILSYAIKVDVVSERDIEKVDHQYQIYQNKYHNNNYISELRGSTEKMESFEELMLNTYFMWNLLQENKLGDRSSGFIKHEANIDFVSVTFHRLVTFNKTNSYYGTGKSQKVSSPKEEVGSPTGVINEKEIMEKIKAKRENINKIRSSVYKVKEGLNGIDISKMEDYLKFYGVSSPLLTVKVTGLGMKTGMLNSKIERICGYIGSVEIEDQSNSVPLYMSTVFSGGNTTMMWSWLYVRRKYYEYKKEINEQEKGQQGENENLIKDKISSTLYGYYRRVQRYIDATMDFNAHSHNHIYNSDDQENLDRIVESIIKMDKNKKDQVDLKEIYIRESRTNKSNEEMSQTGSYCSESMAESVTRLSRIIEDYKDDYINNNDYCNNTNINNINNNNNNIDSKSSQELFHYESSRGSCSETSSFKGEDETREERYNDVSKNLGLLGMVFGGCPCFVSVSLVSGTTRSCSIYVSSMIVTLPWEIVDSFTTYFNSVQAYIKDIQTTMQNREKYKREDSEYKDYEDDMETVSDLTSEDNKEELESQEDTTSVSSGTKVGEDDETVRESYESSEEREGTYEGTEDSEPESELHQFYETHPEVNKKFSFNIHVGLSSMNLFTESAWTGYGYFVKYMHHRTVKNKDEKSKVKNLKWRVIRAIIKEKGRKAYMIYPITINITGQGSLYLTHIKVKLKEKDEEQKKEKEVYRNQKFDMYCKKNIDEIFRGWFQFMPCVFEVKTMCRNVNIKLTREASGGIMTPSGYTMCDVYLDMSTEFKQKRTNFIKYIKMDLLMDKRYRPLLNLAKNSLFDPSNLNTSKIIDPFRMTLSTVLYLYGNDRSMWSKQMMPQSLSVHVKLEPVNVSVSCVDILCLVDFGSLLLNFFDLFKYHPSLVLHASNEFLSMGREESTTPENIKITRLFTSTMSNKEVLQELYEESYTDKISSTSSYNEGMSLNTISSIESISKRLTDSELGKKFTSGLKSASSSCSSTNSQSYSMELLDRKRSDFEMEEGEMGQNYFDNRFSSHFYSPLDETYENMEQYQEKEEIMSAGSTEYEEVEEESIFLKILTTVSVGMSVEVELLNVEVVSNVTAGVKHMFNLTIEDTGFWIWINNIFDCEYLEAKSRIPTLEFGVEEGAKGPSFNDPLLHKESTYHNIGEIERENVAYLEQFSGVLRGGVLEISSSSLPNAMNRDSTLVSDTHVIIDYEGDKNNIRIKGEGSPNMEGENMSKEKVTSGEEEKDVEEGKGGSETTKQKLNTRSMRYTIKHRKMSEEKCENIIGVDVEEDRESQTLNLLDVDQLIDREKIPSLESLKKFLGSPSKTTDSSTTDQTEEVSLDEYYQENVKNFIQFRFHTSITFDLCKEGNREMAVETFKLGMMGYKQSLPTKLYSRVESSWINLNVTLNAAECYFGFLAYFSVMLKLKQMLLQSTLEESKILDSVTKYTVSDHITRLSTTPDPTYQKGGDPSGLRFTKDYPDQVKPKASKELNEYNLARMSKEVRPSKESRLSKIYIETRLSKSSYPDFESAADYYSLPIKNVNREMVAKCLVYRYVNGLLQPSEIIDINQILGSNLKMLSEIKLLGLKKMEPVYMSHLKLEVTEQTINEAYGQDGENELEQDKKESKIYQVPIEHNVVHVGKAGHSNVFGRDDTEEVSKFHNKLGQTIAIAVKSRGPSQIASLNTIMSQTSSSSIVVPSKKEKRERKGLGQIKGKENNILLEEKYRWVILKAGESCELPEGHYGILEPFLVRVQIENKIYEISSKQIEFGDDTNQMMFKLNLTSEDSLQNKEEEDQKDKKYAPGISKYAKEYVKRIMGRKDLETTYNYAYLMVKVVQKMSMQASNMNQSSINVYLSSGISVINKSTEAVVVFPSKQAPQNRLLALDSLIRIESRDPSVSDRELEELDFKESKMTEFDKLLKPISALTEHKLVRNLDPSVVEETSGNEKIEGQEGGEEIPASERKERGQLQYMILKGDLDNVNKVFIPLPWIISGDNIICASLLSDFNQTDIRREEKVEVQEEPYRDYNFLSPLLTCDVLLHKESCLHIISSFEGHRIKVPVPGFVPTLHLGVPEKMESKETRFLSEPLFKQVLDREGKNIKEADARLILSCTLTELTTVNKTQIPFSPMKHCLKQYELILEPCQIIENMMPYDINIVSPLMYNLLNSRLSMRQDTPTFVRSTSFGHLSDEKDGQKEKETFSRSLSISDTMPGKPPVLPGINILQDLEKLEDREKNKNHIHIKSTTSVHLETYMKNARIIFNDFLSNETQFKNENVTTTIVFEKINGLLLQNCQNKLGIKEREKNSNLPNKLTLSLEIFKRSTQPSKDKEGLVRRYLASSQIVCTIYADKWVVNWLEYPILLSRSDGRYLQCFGGNGCSLLSQDLSNTRLHIVLRKNNLKMIHSYEMYPSNPKKKSGFRITSPAHLISDKFVVPDLTFSYCSVKDVQNFPNLHYLVSTSIAPMPFFRTVVMEILPQVTVTNDFDLDIWIREYITSKNVVKTVIKKTGILPKLYTKINSMFHTIRTKIRTGHHTLVHKEKTENQIILKKYRTSKRRRSLRGKRSENSGELQGLKTGTEKGPTVHTTAKWIKIDSGMTVEFHPQSKGEFYLQLTSIDPKKFYQMKNIRFWSCSLLIKPSSSTQFRYPENLSQSVSEIGGEGERMSGFEQQENKLESEVKENGNGSELAEKVEKTSLQNKDNNVVQSGRQNMTYKYREEIVKYGLCEVETLVHKGCKMVRFSRPKTPEWVIINMTGFNLFIQQLGIMSHGEVLAKKEAFLEGSLTIRGIQALNRENRDFAEMELESGTPYSWYDPQKEQKLIIKLYNLQDKNNETLEKYINKGNINVDQERVHIRTRGVLLIDLSRVESINTSNIFNIKIGKVRLAAKVNAQTSVIMGQRTLILTCRKLSKMINRNKKFFDIYKQIRIKIPNEQEKIESKNYLMNRFKYNKESSRARGIRVSNRSLRNTVQINSKLMETHKLELPEGEKRQTRMIYLNHTSSSGGTKSKHEEEERRKTYPLSNSAIKRATKPDNKEMVINITNDYTLNISLNGLGICICSYLPDELLYLSLVLVKFNTSFEDNETKYVFSVGWLQSDVHDLESYFPTMLKPVVNYSTFNTGSINKKKASSYVHHDIITNTNKEVINIVMNTKNNRYIREISLLSIDIQPININLDTRIIFSGLLLLDHYLSIFSQSERSIESLSAPKVGIFNYEDMQSFDEEVYVLNALVKSQYGGEISSDARYNISRLLIGKIVMVINLRRSETLQNEELPPMSPIIRYLVYLVRRTPHISDAHIVLNKESLLRLCCTPYVLMSHFASRYVSQAMHQIYKVLWAVDLIGNPKIIFNHWFSGMYRSWIDFREAMRFVHLPPVTFLLLLKGLSHLGISVLSGMVEAFYRLTGSWCFLLNTVALNSDRYAVFLLNQVFPRNFGHPTNVLEGIYFGSMMMGRNLYISLGNFVFKPVSTFNKFLESIRLKSGKREILMSFLHIWSSMFSSMMSLFFGTFSSMLSGMSVSLQGLLNQIHSVPMLTAIRPKRSFQLLKSTGPMRYNFLESWSMEASKRVGQTNQVLMVLPLDLKPKLFDPVYLATSHWSVLATHTSSISPLILSQSFGNFKDLIWIDRQKLGYAEKGRIKWRYNIKTINRIQLVQLNTLITEQKKSGFDSMEEEIYKEEYYGENGQNYQEEEEGNKRQNEEESKEGEDVRIVVYDKCLGRKGTSMKKGRIILPMKKGKKMLGKKMYFMRILFSETGDGRQFHLGEKKKIPTKLRMALENPRFLKEYEEHLPNQIHKQIHENLDIIKMYLARSLNENQSTKPGVQEGSDMKLEEGIYAKDSGIKKDLRVSFDSDEWENVTHRRDSKNEILNGTNGELYRDPRERPLKNVAQNRAMYGSNSEFNLPDIEEHLKTLSKVDYKNVDEGERDYMLQKGDSKKLEFNRRESVKYHLNEEKRKTAESEVNLNEVEERIYREFNSIIEEYRVRKKEEEASRSKKEDKNSKGRSDNRQKEGSEETEENDIVEIIKMPNLETAKLYFILLTSVIREVAL